MIKVQIKGLDKLAKNLAKYPKESAKNIQQAITASIFQVERKAKPKTPVDTGRLRAGYRHKFGFLTGTLFNPVKYALKQHEGIHFKHRVGEAKFMEKGLHQSLGWINSFFEKALEKTLKAIARR